jgi:hypothetical protein
VKRILSLLFLGVFLLNVFGLYGIFVGLRVQLTDRVRENLDESNYAMSDEVTFKVPITIPYAVDMTEYARVDGEFQHEGEVYRLVKQKLFKDTLYVVCVKDARTQKIDRALEDYVKTFSDKPSSEKGSSKTIITFSKDFIAQSLSIESRQAGWEQSFPLNTDRSEKIISMVSEIVQPPRI